MTTVDKVLENCRIMTTTGSIDADIAIDQGKIVQVARSTNMPDASERIDIRGNIVIPGVIDPHVHFREPGLEHKGDFGTESMAAAFGGVTTVFDMPNTKPRTDSLQRMQEKRALVSGKACVDYGFYYELSDKSVRHVEDAPLYKGYLDSGLFSFDSLRTVLKTLDNKVICLHAEDYESINTKKYGKKAESHSAVRPLDVEAKGISKVLHLDFGTNRVHFCHVTSGEAIGLIKSSGKNASCETCPQYLFLDVRLYKSLKNFAKVNPPLRSRESANQLWAMLSQIDLVASDHAPHLPEEKEESIELAASGFPGVETLLPLMINAVNEKQLTWQELVRLTSHGAMQVFGLRNKGEIAVGKDADIVVIDRDKEWFVDVAELHSKCSWTPYQGMQLRGTVEKVFLRGKTLVDEGEFTGKKGFGDEIWV